MHVRFPRAGVTGVWESEDVVLGTELESSGRGRSDEQTRGHVCSRGQTSEAGGGARRVRHLHALPSRSHARSSLLLLAFQTLPLICPL